MFEIDYKNLSIVRSNNFDKPLLSLENAFISSKNEIFLLTGDKGIVYYLNKFNDEPIYISNENTSLIFQLIEFNGSIIGGNNKGLIIYKNGTFEMLKFLDCAAWTLKIDNDKLYVGSEDGLGIFKDNNY